MEPNRFLVIEFLDGKKESFTFPAPPSSPAARKMRLEDFMQGQFVVIQLEHEIQLFPLSAIRSIRLSGFMGLGPNDEIGLPISAIRGAEQI
ncbi:MULTISPECIES: hypothetical protein [Uliginosibacterium]|jgi:hypothetical protein|uniref:Uncharacterized protein n=1 Tax=Uliginosibacterium aquaticum TaxID=2731212 RepID=A0ABX2IRU8_9RHOO|nr:MULTISPECIES: hypothetical protein [Uliginosibacterium]MDO6386477.1 hypothetical protein [Uliginosibacterium sp. 31-12]NSL56948.1 hypothetical protein [Uliginosibacterium aquaticum]PLK50318.1 hypothetical protein C0V76_00350 [Uliginosibacterium sp. TH139]